MRLAASDAIIRCEAGDKGPMEADIEQHSLSWSIALHLLPGALVLAFYLTVGVPVATRLGYPSVLGVLLAVAFVLIACELGWLLSLGRERSGRLSLEGCGLYRDPRSA